MRSHLKRNRCPVCHSTKFGPSCSTCDKRKSSGSGSGNGACGRDAACVRNPRANPLTQPAWFIDPVDGSDANSGATLACALRTWAEWRRRVCQGPGPCDSGAFTELCPTGDVGTIFIANDLPDSDPIVIRNFICSGATIVVRSARRIVATGTLDAVGERDRAANAPFTIHSPDIADWTPYLRLMVRIVETGARAYVARAFADGTAHVTSWVQEGGKGFLPELAPDLTTDPISEPAPTPEVGMSFEVIDFASFVLSDLTAGYDPSRTAQDSGPPGGLIFHNVRVRKPPADIAPSFPFALGSMYGVLAFHDSLIDTSISVPPGSFAHIAGNVSFGGLVDSYSNNLTITDGLFRPEIGTPPPGALFVHRGAEGALAGDVTFVGTGDPADNTFTPADMSMAGLMVSGPISFWDSFHGPNMLPAGILWFQAFSPIFGESCYVPLWGNGNLSDMFFFPGAKMLIEQFCFGDDPPLPSYENVTGPDGPVANLSFCSDEDRVGHAWQRAIAQFTPPIPTTWDNFLVPICECNPCCAPAPDPGGFLFKVETFSFPPEPPFFPGADVREECSHAVDPATNAGIYFLRVRVDFMEPAADVSERSERNARFATLVRERSARSFGFATRPDITPPRPWLRSAHADALAIRARTR